MTTNRYEHKHVSNDWLFLGVQGLISLTTDIQRSLMIDCTTYIGLHKLLDFNILSEEWKLLFMALFTNYQDKRVITPILTWLPDFKENLELGHINYLSNEQHNQLVDFFLFKCEHIRQLNQLFSHQIAPAEYTQFANSNPYDTPYPFMEYTFIEDIKYE